MEVKYTKEQLNKLDRDMLILLFLSQQEQLASMNQKLQLILEQLTCANRNRFRCASEKMEPSGLLTFKEVNGAIVLYFNEVEAL